MSDGLTIFPAEQLESFTRRVLLHFGTSEEDAASAAKLLILGDLRGIDSHGIARLFSYYGMLKIDRLNPRPEITVVRETATTATLDGDNGLGLIVGPKANQVAMDKADEVGTGWVAVRNTNHFGIAGYYVMEALKRDQIGQAMTNTTPIVVPMWGADRMLGTNPLAIAFPGLEEPPIVIDMATPAAAYGKLEMAMRTGESIPVGWAIDADGNETSDPNAVANGGAMLPLGSTREMGGHKGFCLSSMVDLLCGPLSGANWGPFTPPFTLEHAEPRRQVGKGLGNFFGAMQIEAFIDATEFKRQIDDWIRTMRATRPAPGTNGPIIPGDPERLAHEERLQSGIPLVAAVVNDLRSIEAETGLTL
jgi:LDH2 family malate/lactate/ureidoglycolate dehydrogenase